MRFLVMIKSDERSEAGVMPSQEFVDAMGKYNEDLAKAGVFVAGEGLHPSSKGARVRFSGGKTTVIDGPFTEAKEIVAGFWLLDVRSKEEAVEWVKRIPVPREGAESEGEIEIRQVFDAEDFAKAMSAQ